MFFGIEWNKYLIDIVNPLYLYFLPSIIDGTLLFWYRHNFLVSHHHVITVLRVLYPFVYIKSIARFISSVLDNN
jgi:hypothetical protein